MVGSPRPHGARFGEHQHRVVLASSQESQCPSSCQVCSSTTQIRPSSSQHRLRVGNHSQTMLFHVARQGWRNCCPLPAGDLVEKIHALRTAFMFPRYALVMQLRGKLATPISISKDLVITHPAYGSASKDYV